MMAVFKSQRLQYCVLSLILGITLKVELTSASCRDDLAQLPPNVGPALLVLDENTPAGTVLLDISDGNSLYADTTEFPFLTVKGGKLIARSDFTVDGEEYKDRCEGVKGGFAIDLKCQDEGSHKNIARTLFVSVNLTDDHPPTLNLTDISVREQTSGILIADLLDPDMSSDVDCDSSFDLKIQQDADMDAFFKISGSTIKLEKPLDYESRRQFFFDVSLTTQVSGGEPNNAEGQLVVNVEDVDDMNPKFDSQVYEMVISENNLNDSWFGTAPRTLAVDGDVGINATLDYSIESTNPLIDIDISSDGRIFRIMKVMDREEVDKYTIIVKATQRDNRLASATATFNIVVSDMNDNRPEFSPSQVKVASVLEGAPAGTHVAWLLASDGDKGENAFFDYELANPADRDMFQLVPDPMARLMALQVKDLSMAHVMSYMVEIRLKERRPTQGGEECDFVTSCVTFINVTIEDVNDSRPRFSQPSYQFTVYDASAPTLLGKVTATDMDRGDNADLVYSREVISLDKRQECEKITVSNLNGEVMLMERIEPGVICHYTVTGCDQPAGGKTSRCGYSSMLVNVLEITPKNQDGGPLEYEIHLPENLPVGYLAFTLPVSGLSTSSSEFTIDDKLLLTAIVLDRELQSTHVVTATKGDDTVALRLTVHVDDVNDHAPLFANKDHVITIKGAALVGDVVGRVQAYDEDINDRVTYSLINMEDVFDINPLTGAIYLNTTPIIANNLVKKYGGILMVEAKDSNVPYFTTMTEVKIKFLLHDESASILVPVRLDDLTANTTKVESIISDILDVKAKVVHLESIWLVQDIGSRVLFTAISNNGRTTTAVEMDWLLSTHAQEIYDEFKAKYAHLPSSSSSSVYVTRDEPPPSVGTVVTVAATRKAPLSTITTTTTTVISEDGQTSTSVDVKQNN